MRKLVVGLVVTAVLLAVADRAAVAVAEQSVAAQLQASAELRARPEVQIRGFPFLSQALAGRYDDVRVSADAVAAGRLPVDLDVDLSGLQVPLSEALSGSVTAVPVDALAARALVTYDVLARQSGSRSLRVAPAGRRVAVTGAVEVLGRRLQATALSSVRLSGGTLVVRAEELRVGNEIADAVVTAAVGGRLDLRVPVGDLPYGLELTGVEVVGEGVALRAAARDTVLTRSGLR